MLILHGIKEFSNFIKMGNLGAYLYIWRKFETAVVKARNTKPWMWTWRVYMAGGVHTASSLLENKYNVNFYDIPLICDNKRFNSFIKEHMRQSKRVYLRTKLPHSANCTSDSLRGSGVMPGQHNPSLMPKLFVSWMQKMNIKYIVALPIIFFFCYSFSCLLLQNMLRTSQKSK